MPCILNITFLLFVSHLSTGKSYELTKCAQDPTLATISTLLPRFSFLSWYLPLAWLQPLLIIWFFPFSSHCSHNLDHTTLCSALLVFSSTAKTNPHIGKHFSHFWVSASLALAHLTAVTHLSSLAVWTALLNATLTLKFIEFVSTFSGFFLKYNFYSLKFS